MVDQLLKDPIEPVQEAAKVFIESMFTDKELSIKEVKVTDYNLVFKNQDDDPVNELAIKLLSTIAEQKEDKSEMEIAVNGLLQFLGGADVNESLKLEVTLEDGKVITIDKLSASFTRDRSLTEEEINSLQGLN